MRSGLLFAVTLPAVLAVPFLTCSASAQTAKDAAAQKLACVQASDKAQQLRVAGKLVAARDTLRTCVVDTCPTVIREACSQWLGEVTSSLPSIVIGAKDGDGKDILDIKVSIDGALVTEHLGGRALPIDPGRHKMRYEAADGAVLEEDILVGEGTKNRQVAVQFPGAAKAAAAVPGPTTEASLGPRGASTGNTVAGTVFAVVGAGALGTALALDLSTTSSVNADKAAGGCATKPGGCSASTVNGYQVDYDIAGVALGVGIVAVGVALYVFIAHPFGERHPVAAADAQKTASHEAGPTFRVVPSPHGSGFALSF